MSRRRAPFRPDVEPVLVNDPSRKGEIACSKEVFGDHSRYAVYAVHTRFDAVHWVVADAETIDPVTGEYCAWIRQGDSKKEVLEGLV
jgi:hypothetical protein